MRWRLWYAVGLVLAVLGIVAVTAKTTLDRMHVPPWGNPAGESLTAEIAGGTRVGQTFRAPLPGLFAVEVWLEPTEGGGEAGRPAAPVVFHLQAGSGYAEDLVTSVLDPLAVAPGSPVRVEFEPLRVSQGRVYGFSLESPTASAGNGYAARFGAEARIEGASATLDGQPVDGNLQFRTLYTLRTRDKAALLLERMAPGGPGSRVLLVGLAMAYAAVLGALLWTVAGAVLEEGR